MGRAIRWGFLVCVAARGLLVLLEEYFISALCIVIHRSRKKECQHRLPLLFHQDLLITLFPLVGLESWRLVTRGVVSEYSTTPLMQTEKNPTEGRSFCCDAVCKGQNPDLQIYLICVSKNKIIYRACCSRYLYSG